MTESLYPKHASAPVDSLKVDRECRCPYSLGAVLCCGDFARCSTTSRSFTTLGVFSPPNPRLR